jgi:hypothetical protein
MVNSKKALPSRLCASTLSGSAKDFKRQNKIALLRYSHTMTSTLLKCTVQGFYSFRVVQTPLVPNFGTFSSPQTEIAPTNSHFPFPPASHPWRLLIYFLSLWTYLLWTVHINGICNMRAKGFFFLWY